MSGSRNLVLFFLAILPRVDAQSQGSYQSPNYGQQNQGSYPSPNYGQQPLVNGLPAGVQPAVFTPVKNYNYNAQPNSGYDNTATCTFDKKCFQWSEGCTFLNCNYFNRTSPISCEDCLNLCLTMQNTNTPYCCKAVVYNFQYRICDLFNQDIGGNLQNLAKSPGHTYFQPTGICSASTPAPSICAVGEVEKIVAVKNYQLPGFTGQTTSAPDAFSCARLCLSNKLSDGTAFSCRSAQFSNGQCTVSTSQSKAEGSLQPADGTTYFQKLCFPAALVAGCGDIFEEDPQKVIVGQSRQITDASSVNDCLKNCLNAKNTFGFTCASAMYFGNVTTQNCIMNEESKVTKPDLFTSTPDPNEFYLETQCGGAGVGSAPLANTNTSTGTGMRLRDQALGKHVAPANSVPLLWGRTANSNNNGLSSQQGTLWGRVRRQSASNTLIRKKRSVRQPWN